MIKNVVIWSDHVAGASIRYLARPWAIKTLWRQNAE